MTDLPETFTLHAPDKDRIACCLAPWAAFAVHLLPGPLIAEHDPPPRYRAFHQLANFAGVPISMTPGVNIPREPKTWATLRVMSNRAANRLIEEQNRKPFSPKVADSVAKAVAFFRDMAMAAAARE